MFPGLGHVSKVNMDYSPTFIYYIVCSKHNISKFGPHSVFMFCTDFRTNSDFCPTQHLRINYYNRKWK